MMLSAARTLIDYHYAAYERVWAAASQLSQEEFTRDFDYSLGSVRNQLAHVMNVDDRWLSRLQSRPLPPNLDFEDYPEAQSAQEKWMQIAQRVQAYAAGLDSDQLQQSVELHFPGRGGSHRNMRWQILLHVVNHGTDHRAQILALLHELGAPSFEQDLILHLWSRAED